MSSFRVRSLLVSTFFSVSLSSLGVARAELRLDEAQSTNFYVSHVSSIALLATASLAIASDPPVVLGARWHGAPEFERSVQQKVSPVTATISDITLLTNLLAPFASLYVVREGASYQNSAIIYGQALSTSFLLNSMTKNIALRARPYAAQKTGSENIDDHLSFYSGHSSMSFTAAVSGSWLFSAVEADLTRRSVHLGAALGLASLTAHARVRAGRHYPTDVLVGAVAGIGVGIAVPLLHGVQVQFSEEEIASAGAGLFLGTVLGGLLPDGVKSEVAAFAPEVAISETGLNFSASGRF